MLAPKLVQYTIPVCAQLQLLQRDALFAQSAYAMHGLRGLCIYMRILDSALVHIYAATAEAKSILIR